MRIHRVGCVAVATVCSASGRSCVNGSFMKRSCRDSTGSQSAHKRQARCTPVTARKTASLLTRSDRGLVGIGFLAVGVPGMWNGPWMRPFGGMPYRSASTERVNFSSSKERLLGKRPNFSQAFPPYAWPLCGGIGLTFDPFLGKLPIALTKRHHLGR